MVVTDLSGVVGLGGLDEVSRESASGERYERQTC